MIAMESKTEWRTQIHQYKYNNVQGIKTGAYLHPQTTSLQCFQQAFLNVYLIGKPVTRSCGMGPKRVKSLTIYHLSTPGLYRQKLSNFALVRKVKKEMQRYSFAVTSSDHVHVNYRIHMVMP